MFKMTIDYVEIIHGALEVRSYPMRDTHDIHYKYNIKYILYPPSIEYKY